MKRFVYWLKGHLNRQWSGHSFYEEAGTSVREGSFPPAPYITFQAYRVSYVPTDKIKKVKWPGPKTATSK
jgi:hypothetical protein